MVILIKKIIPVYNRKDKVPKPFLNLTTTKYITTFKHLYPNIPKILVKEYGLDRDDRVTIWWMKEVNLPHFSRYRTNLRPVHKCAVKDIEKHLDKIRRKINGYSRHG